MGTLREYIDGYSNNTAQEKLYAFIESRESEPDPRERAKWQERNSKLKEYRGNYQRPASINDKQGGSIEKRLTFDSLTDILRIAGMSGKEFFEAIGVTVQWPSRDFQRLAQICEQLSEKDRKAVAETAFFLSTDWWKQEKIIHMQPSLRIRAYFKRTVPYTLQSGAPKTLLAVSKYGESRQGPSTVFLTIPVEDFPAISVYLQLSPHWLMRLPEDVPFFGTTGDVDSILDAYSFMTRRTKQYFLQAVSDLCRGNGGKCED